MAFRSNSLSLRQKQILRRATVVTLGLAAGPIIGAIVARVTSGPSTLADGDGIAKPKVYVARPVQVDDGVSIAQAKADRMPAALLPLPVLRGRAGEGADLAAPFEVHIDRLANSHSASPEIKTYHWVVPSVGALGEIQSFAEVAPATHLSNAGLPKVVTHPFETAIWPQETWTLGAFSPAFSQLWANEPAVVLGLPSVQSSRSTIEPPPQPSPGVPGEGVSFSPAPNFSSQRSSVAASPLPAPRGLAAPQPFTRVAFLTEFDEPIPPIVEAGPKDYLPSPPPLDPPVPTDSPLMRGLGSGKENSWIDKSGLLVGGYVQGGYTYNPNRSGGDLNFGRVFDESYANAVQLDQLELSVARVPARDKFDIGGRIEVIYGYDTARFHANGLNGYFGCNDELTPSAQDRDRHDPRNQLDLTQAYLDFNLEVGTGLLIRAGKFVTPLGFETIDPNSTPFYSRSYLFGYAKPFTHTGILLNYRFDEEFEVWGGVVRGWDQALDDSNNSVSLIGRFDWRPDARINVRAGMIWGREAEQCDCGCPDSDSSRILFDVVTTYAATDDLTLGAEGLYGRSGGADATNRSAEWFGFAGYSSYYLGPGIDLNGRVEWFHDGDGTRLQNGETIEMTSVTLGLSYRPFHNSRTLAGLRLQPEVRYDHATKREFDGGTRNNQFTIGLGVLYAF